MLNTRFPKRFTFLLLYGVLALCRLTPTFAQEIVPTEAGISAAENPLGLARQSRQTMLQLGTLFGSSVQNDAVHSPLLHVGLTGGTELRLRAYSREVLVDIAATFGAALLSPVPAQPLNPNAGIVMIQSNTALALGFNAYRSEDQTLRFFVGPLLNTMIHAKFNTTFGNSAFAFDLHFALGATARVEKDFVLWGKQWRASSQINLPLVGFAQRPYYSTNSPSVAANETFALLDLQPVSTFNFPNIAWQTGLEFMLGTGNWLGVAYQWNFYDYNRFNRVQFARHALILSLGVRLE